MALKNAEATDIVKADEIKRVEVHDNRYYKVETAKKLYYFPSSTTILGAYPAPYLAKWRGDVGNETADLILMRAGDRGSRIHHGIEKMIQGYEVIYNPPYDPISDEEMATMTEHPYLLMTDQSDYLDVIKVQRMLEKVQAHNIISETTVYSVIHQFAGTADIIAYIPNAGEYEINGSKPMYLDSGWWLMDIKTGKTISKTAKYQLASYLVAYEELNPHIKIQGTMVLHTSGKTRSGIEGLSVQSFTRPENIDNFKKFLQIYDMWKIDNPTPNPKTLELPRSIKYDNKILNI